MRVRTKVGPGARAVDVEHGKTQHYAGPLQPGVKCQQGARLGPQGCCQVEGVEFRAPGTALVPPAENPRVCDPRR